MAQHRNDSPRVAPSRPKGSGRRAPRIVFALILAGLVAIVVSVAIVVVILRS